MKKALFIAAIAVSFNANAIKHGTDVSKAEYSLMDNLVNIVDVSTGSTCGATLIASDWLLTARHCTTYYTDDASTDPVYSGEEMNIAVYQGVEGVKLESNLKYSGVGYVYTPGADFEAKANMQEFNSELDDLLNYTYCSSEPCENFNKLETITSSNSDIALIKLERPISYTKTVKVVKTHEFPPITEVTDLVEYQSKTEKVAKSGESLVFRGWGLTEDGSRPNVLQKMDLNIDTASFELKCYPVFGFDGLGDNCDLESLNSPLLTAVSLVVNTHDTVLTLSEETAANYGDSGTPLVSTNNEVIGVVSRTGGSFTRFTSLTPLTKWVQQTVDALNYPSVVELSSGSSQFAVEVQNLSTTNQVILPSTISDAQVESNCPQTLAQLESCLVTVTFGDSVDGTVEVKLTNDDSITIKLGESTSPVDPTDPVEPTDPSDGSSGGSTSFISFIALLALIRLRKTK